MLVRGAPASVAGRFLWTGVLRKSGAGVQEADHWVSLVQLSMGERNEGALFGTIHDPIITSVCLSEQHRKTHSVSGSGEPAWGESTLHKGKLLAVVIQTFETHAHVF